MVLSEQWQPAGISRQTYAGLSTRTGFNTIFKKLNVSMKNVNLKRTL